MKSSSFININGDIRHNKLSILIYIIINLLQNIYYSLFFKKFKFINFNPKNKKYNFNDQQSISRKLCGVFWSNIDWKKITLHIGKLNINEIGCGDGQYFKKEISIKNKFIQKYNGFDVKSFKNWKKYKNKKFVFRKFNGYSFNKVISKNNNLFISQSCLEHVKDDLSFFHEIKKKANQTKKKIILMHCIPNSFCLFSYLTHGFRQYNIQNLNKIAKIFGNKKLFVVKLGNFYLNIEHLKKTTFPLIFKKENLMPKQNKNYYSTINKLLIKNQNSSYFFSSFAVIIGFLNFHEREKQKVIKKIFS